MDLEETTIRDFGGGWNISDSDKSLGPRYQPVSDNVIRGTDGHFRVRYGYELFANLRLGTETTFASTTYPLTTTGSSGVVTIQKIAHGFSDGDHVTISNFTGGDIDDLSASLFNSTFGIKVVDADNFKIYVRAEATSGLGDGRTFDMVHDDHVMSGQTIGGRYYKDNLIVFSANGEIAAINSSGVATSIWNNAIASDLTLTPWSDCARVSAEIIRGRLIVVNGRANDKPLAIEDTTANYLVDASSLSNSAIPRADFVIAVDQYVVLVNTEYGTTMLEIGARNTVGTFSREVSPSDAVEIDIGMMTQTTESSILGASVVRNRVFLGFTDRTLLGELGLYNGTVHEPDINDNIGEFGTFSHNSIISLGNDLFCAGMNGINSLELSRSSGEFIPTTVSDFIHPQLLRHFKRLSENDRRYRIFAVHDINSRSYELFVPKYTETTQTLLDNPIIVTTTMQQYSIAILQVPNHSLDEGDSIVIAGATNFNANLTGSMVNGTRTIRHVIDDNTIVIEIDDYPEEINTDFGGSSVTVTPVNDETIGYVYEYNPRLKIRRWTKFRNMNFDWGARSQLNAIFYGKNGKIWRKGDVGNRLSGDKMGEYDYASYSTAFAYSENDRVLDTNNNIVYKCLVAHTSDASDTFSQARTNVPLYWEEYRGEEIAWALDTPWSDFNTRKGNKQVELVSFDTKGSATFTFSIFTNSFYKGFESYQLSPVRSTDFVGQDSPGFGAGDQPFGGGRNTAQEWLHSMPVSGKLFRLRFSGSSTHPLQISAATMYYHKTKVLT